ncbi:MAG: hypothetical protein WC356_04955 [Candidatus Micrarchaeia archaeon]|jgi:hypothetical protein
MDKNILKVIVLAIIGLFVFQMVGISFLQSLRDDTIPDTANQNGEVYVIQGTTNVTVSSYSSYLAISGDLTNLKEIREDFKEKGWYDSETYITKNETIFNIDSKYVKEASDILLEKGYSTRTGVSLKFPDQLGENYADEIYASIETVPIYNIGDPILIEFAAYAQDNKVLQLAGFDLVPYSATLILDSRVEKIKSTIFDISTEDTEKQNIISEKYNVTFEGNKTNIKVDSEEYDYLSSIVEDIEISQNLEITILPSEKDGVYEAVNFVVNSKEKNEVGDIIKIKITGVLDKGKIVNIIGYEIVKV